MIDIVKKYAEPLNIYIGLVLILGIVYVGKLPDWFTYQANTALGRLLLFSLTIFVAEIYSVPYAFLMATFSVLVLALAPRNRPRSLPSRRPRKEGFEGDEGSGASDMEVKLVNQKRRWWSEEVLGENPIGIEEERVRTQPIQDASNPSSSSSTSIGR